MNVVDSSGWLEYFTNGPNAKHFASPVRDTANLVVPTVCIYEALKVTLRESSEENAARVFSIMQKGLVVDFTSQIAEQTSRISLDLHLPLADSAILATARAYNATLWTQDAHFSAISGVKYFSKR